ncbi:MerR family transcriptional regulator [Orenia metallireducens]|uniref:MerR family transcriptional regulator n=1 Tax=Orenia metallireducens TaxID=1413210 RepID=A0A1C0ABP7_9FIRM|nr:MerR family transcriptional regulator [Orenia metallireducens]OCL27754.1 MerR family transcriptional regulator [Orenia metallireducens]
MGYTIRQVAEMVDLTTYTLRYYEKEGLLPFIERNEHGNRVFKDSDIEWIQLVCCLRDTGMSISEIKDYVNLCIEGDKTTELRRQIILDHKLKVEQKIEKMKQSLVKINKKLKCYNDLTISEETDVCNPNYKTNE